MSKVLSEHTETNKSETYNIFCEAVDAYLADQYLLFQNDKLLAKSETGIFRNIKHSQIETGSGFSVIVIGQDHSKTRTELKLVIPGIVEIYETEFSVLSNSYSIKIPDKVPFIGGMSFEADISELPVCIVKKDGMLKFGMNIDKKYFLSNGGEKNKEELLKSIIKQFKDGKFDKKVISDIDKNSKGPLESAFGPIKVKVSGVGYGLTPYNEKDRFNSLGSEVALAIKLNGGYTWRTFVYAIPFSVSIDASVQGKIGSKMMYNFDTKKFTGDVKSTIKLGFEPFVAIGLNDTLRGGIYGNAESAIAFKMLTENGLDTGVEKITFAGKGGLQFRYLGKKYTWIWKEAEYQLYPGEVTVTTGGGIGGR